VALFTGGSRGIGAAIPRRLATDEADVVSVFVTNGGYNGVQQVLRLSTPLAPKPHQTSKPLPGSSLHLAARRNRHEDSLFSKCKKTARFPTHQTTNKSIMKSQQERNLRGRYLFANSNAF
jgi:NAD(P)-dependent dehydrogenase (short-subunit alcohol dehydrogenase family)